MLKLIGSMSKKHAKIIFGIGVVVIVGLLATFVIPVKYLGYTISIAGVLWFGFIWLVSIFRLMLSDKRFKKD